MTNFDLLKKDIQKCNNAEEFQNVLDDWRYNKFPCEMNEKCIVGYSCKVCYESFLESEVMD